MRKKIGGQLSAGTGGEHPIGEGGQIHKLPLNKKKPDGLDDYENENISRSIRHRSRNHVFQRLYHAAIGGQDGGARRQAGL